MKNLVKYFAFLFILALFASCGKDWLDVNTDPNNAAAASAENILPAAELSSGVVTGGYYNLLGQIWSQYYTQNSGSNQYKYIDAYGLLSSDFQNQFGQMYGTLLNLKYIESDAASQDNWAYYLMATVVECYDWQVLVDLYDQIPFNEALQGVENQAPKYDNAQTVYDSLIARIDYALAQPMNVLTTAQASKDYFFGGNMAKWIQFANTLKLKIYMRQMYIRPSVAQAGIQQLYADGANFLTSDAKLDIFIDAPYKDNPLYESDKRSLNTTTNLAISATLYKYFKNNNDTRLSFLVGTGTNPLPQGGNQIPTNLISNVIVAKLNATDPVFFISAAESYFLQAEAVAMGWGTGDDKALYDAGVMAAFSRFGLDGSSFVAAGGAYLYPSAGTFEQKQEAIIMAKWASMARSQGIESYLETNRTHYPIESPLNAQHWNTSTFSPTNPLYLAWNGGERLYSLNGSTGYFPKRLVFPASERLSNPNTPAEIPASAKVWWDVKP